MKIRTITCHDVYNYGASLQAFALLHYLELQGYDVQIIDYRPEYLCTQYKFWHVPQNSRFYKWTLKSKLFHLLFCLYLAPKKYATYRRVFHFKKFKNNYLKCTRTYFSYKELQNDPPIADCYICGSDQIWNTRLQNGLDPAFYCNFGFPETKRISYAASFGTPEIQAENIETVKNGLSCLDSISIRETTGLKILNSLGYKGVNVVDPVLLLSKEEWESSFDLTKRPTNFSYILVYDLDNNIPALEEQALQLAKDNGWKIVSLCGLAANARYADIIIKNAGPVEFVAYIRNASFVMSTSFHATVFSVIFNKPFGCYYKKYNVSRMKNFLDTAGLSDRLNPKTADTTIDYKKVHNHIHQLIESSRGFINKSILS